jgi:hypothetical protein
MGHDGVFTSQTMTMPFTAMTQIVIKHANYNLPHLQEILCPFRTSDHEQSYRIFQNNTSPRNKCFRIKIYKLCDSTVMHTYDMDMCDHNTTATMLRYDPKHETIKTSQENENKGTIA